MSANAEKVSVAATATELTTDEADKSAGQYLALKNPVGGATVYIGASGVDTTDGYPLDGGDEIAVGLAGGEKLYGIVASGTQDLNVLRTGV